MENAMWCALSCLPVYSKQMLLGQLVRELEEHYWSAFVRSCQKESYHQCTSVSQYLTALRLRVLFVVTADIYPKLLESIQYHQFNTEVDSERTSPTHTFFSDDESWSRSGLHTASPLRCLFQEKPSLAQRKDISNSSGSTILNFATCEIIESTHDVVFSFLYLRTPAVKQASVNQAFCK